MTEQQKTPPEQALKDIEKRLNALRRETDTGQAHSSGGSHSVGRLMWLAFNVISDLIAGVICGFGIGYGIDHWLGTRPVFIAVFLILGCAAGVLNVVRFLRQYEERQREKPADSEE
ncbi:MAG: AtpZ/AtpI family protein [Alphaproteobacteria bacterium]|nr:AtpZ/AtpI family protein [Alphaproteobacteria bacterium]MBO4644838.1 AtpZ/AtpI family protein [Alphaproteobacteria bacterium]